jgi:SAM-dependent methyltransferase
MRDEAKPLPLERLVTVPCDLCGANDSKLLMEKQGVVFDHVFRIVGCRRCGHVYVNPRLDDETIEALYDEAYYSGHGFDRTIDYSRCLDGALLAQTYRDERRTLEEAVDSLEGRSLLDIGCGAGNFVRAMRLAGADAVGFDTSEHARRLCSAYGAPLIATSLDELRKQDRKYDIVTAIEVIEHTTSPSEFLAAIQLYVKPGGVLLIGTGNWSLVRLFPGTPYIMPEGHIQYFTPVTLRALFDKIGLGASESFNFMWAGWRMIGGRLGSFGAGASRIAGRVTARIAPRYGPFPIGRTTLADRS